MLDEKILNEKCEVAQQAVFEGMRMSRKIQEELAKEDCIIKKDRSPVTIADFTVQAIICRILSLRYPEIPIVGEERSDALKDPKNKEIRDKINHYINEDNKIRLILNGENLLSSIDRGGAAPDHPMYWTLDPIDGTKGFLRGEQYAIALALIVSGEVQLGVLGCPNLVIEGQGSTQGYLLYAIKGQGAFLVNVETNEIQRVSASDLTDPRKVRFVESYESSHSNQGLQAEIARKLEMEREPVRLDSQVKYAIIATGNGEIYLRIPNSKTPDYKEKIWDHAAGSIIVEESGGVVTDIVGKKLDFNQGKTLKNNSGIFATIPSVQQKVLDHIKEMIQ